MSHKIGKVDHFPRGDTKVLPFEVTDDSDDPLDLSSADIEWSIRPSRTEDEVLSLDDTGVTIENRDNGDGTFEVHIEEGATSELSLTTYRERVRITDTQGQQATWINELFEISADS